MKIAYIVLCHKNVQQINKLLDLLYDEESAFFIHIDKKANIQKSIHVKPNIHILPNDKRIDIKWGNISMIEATRNLIEAVFDDDKKYDYIWLMSGQDFPLRSKEDIKEYLEQNKGKNFIEIIDEKNIDYKRLLKRNELYYPEWIMKMTLWSRILKIAYMIITGGLTKTLFLKRKNVLGVKYYFGSQWWVLTYDCLVEMYKNIDLFLIYYKNCLVPDESLFQTLFMNSNYKDTCMDKLTFVDWDGQMNHPKTFKIEDYNQLKTVDFLMARKFDENIDNEIIDKLFNELKQR
ncbi:beta-1,6-N-acetylglucosaminyltransferase [uncultured Thomasclavelia sp.]|uniref:beta-1,6-N-acetylglucosaminyltransferase n=1 Tax=uncultured Thomasclavelia sp. TaxID=3025759 RepID=UPI00280BEB00|nr:beta-1,6-N-acetylglucosaminyltransferase [uncultured Thomasclavelia sp.]